MIFGGGQSAHQITQVDPRVDVAAATTDDDRIDDCTTPTGVRVAEEQIVILFLGNSPEKKNYLFFGADEAGQRNAIVSTLIANCRLHQVEPYEYLKDVLTRLPSVTNHQLKDFTPKNWKAARQKTAAFAT